MFPIETISARMLDYYVGRGDALIIDLRDEEAYRRSHVRGAVSIPYEELENRKDLPDNKVLVFIVTEAEQHGGSQRICQKRISNPFRYRGICGVQRKKSCNFLISMIR